MYLDKLVWPVWAGTSPGSRNLVQSIKINFGYKVLHETNIINSVENVLGLVYLFVELLSTYSQIYVIFLLLGYIRIIWRRQYVDEKSKSFVIIYNFLVHFLNSWVT